MCLHSIFKLVCHCLVIILCSLFKAFKIFDCTVTFAGCWNISFITSASTSGTAGRTAGTPAAGRGLPGFARQISSGSVPAGAAARRHRQCQHRSQYPSGQTFGQSHLTSSILDADVSAFFLILSPFFSDCQSIPEISALYAILSGCFSQVAESGSCSMWNTIAALRRWGYGRCTQYSHPALPGGRWRARRCRSSGGWHGRWC